MGDFNLYAGLLITEMTAATQKSTRRIFRAGKMTRLETYRRSRQMATSARGFHKSRVHDAGWEMIALANWKDAFAAWKSGSPNEYSVDLEQMMAVQRANFEKYAEAVARIKNKRL
jgi:hypothetical protein